MPFIAKMNAVKICWLDVLHFTIPATVTFFDVLMVNRLWTDFHHIAIPGFVWYADGEQMLDVSYLKNWRLAGVQVSLLIKTCQLISIRIPITEGERGGSRNCSRRMMRRKRKDRRGRKIIENHFQSRMILHRRFCHYSLAVVMIETRISFFINKKKEKTR